jgi:hypothetical protein
VAAQPGHTKDLQSIQLERGIRIVDSPGVVFDEDDEESSQFGGKARKKGSVLLRNVVRVEDVDDPIAVGTYRSALSLVLPFFSLYLILNLAFSFCTQLSIIMRGVVEEILARTDPEIIQKIYSLPPFNSTLEFLTALALTTGRLLKVSSFFHFLFWFFFRSLPYNVRRLFLTLSHLRRVVPLISLPPHGMSLRTGIIRKSRISPFPQPYIHPRFHLLHSFLVQTVHHRVGWSQHQARKLWGRQRS